MTREEKNKLLDSIGKERNTYAEYANAVCVAKAINEWQ